MSVREVDRKVEIVSSSSGPKEWSVKFYRKDGIAANGETVWYMIDIRSGWPNSVRPLIDNWLNRGIEP